MIGQRIREVRKSRKLTQAALADMAGISRVALVNIETGKSTDVNASTIVKIANALETSTDYLLCVKC